LPNDYAGCEESKAQDGAQRQFANFHGKNLRRQDTRLLRCLRNKEMLIFRLAASEGHRQVLGLCFGAGAKVAILSGSRSRCLSFPARFVPR
jgi:hypothetical protein